MLAVQFSSLHNEIWIMHTLSISNIWLRVFFVETDDQNLRLIIGSFRPLLAIFLPTTWISFTKLKFRRSFWVMTHSANISHSNICLRVFFCFVLKLFHSSFVKSRLQQLVMSYLSIVMKLDNSWNQVAKLQDYFC